MLLSVTFLLTGFRIVTNEPGDPGYDNTYVDPAGHTSYQPSTDKAYAGSYSSKFHYDGVADADYNAVGAINLNVPNGYVECPRFDGHEQQQKGTRALLA